LEEALDLSFDRLLMMMMMMMPVDSKTKRGEHSSGVMSRAYTFVFVRKTLLLEFVSLEFILFLIALGISVL